MFQHDITLSDEIDSWELPAYIMKSQCCFPNIMVNLLVLILIYGHVDAFRPFGFETPLRSRTGGWDVFRSNTNRQRPTTNHRTGHHLLPLPNSKRRDGALSQMLGWDGDDIRWTSRLRRKFLRRRMSFDISTRSQVKTALISLQVLMYGYQILTTIVAVRRKFPSYWPDHSLEMIIDSIWGAGVVHGPLTSTFGFSAAFSKAEHAYRYVTSGFFHEGLLHLLINIGVTSRQASWLATGLGAPLYLTTFLGSIILGNFAHVMNCSDRLFNPNIYLGSSGGISGLYGLMFVCLTRIANTNPSNGGSSSGELVRGMAIMFFLGMWLDNVNTAMNIGGFFGGIIIGILCGPRYTKDYAMRRKNSAGYDPVSREYRRVMGFGIMPTESGMISLKVLYATLLVVGFSIPKYRNIPFAIIRGLRNAI